MKYIEKNQKYIAGKYIITSTSNLSISDTEDVVSLLKKLNEIEDIKIIDTLRISYNIIVSLNNEGIEGEQTDRVYFKNSETFQYKNVILSFYKDIDFYKENMINDIDTLLNIKMKEGKSIRFDRMISSIKSTYSCSCLIEKEVLYDYDGFKNINKQLSENEISEIKKLISSFDFNTNKYDDNKSYNKSLENNKDIIMKLKEKGCVIINGIL